MPLVIDFNERVCIFIKSCIILKNIFIIRKWNILHKN